MTEVNKESWISDFRCGGTEAGYMWDEPHNDQASAMYLDLNFEDAFKIDDISSVFHYEPIAKKDVPSFYMPGELTGECSVLNGILCEDEVPNLPLAVCLSKAPEDHILSIDFTKKVPELDFNFDEDCSLGNSKIADCSRTGIEVAGVSELLVPAPRFSYSTVNEMEDVSRSKCDDATKVEDEQGLRYANDRVSVICSKISVSQVSHKSNDEQCAQPEEVSLVNQCIKTEDLLDIYKPTNSCSGSKSVSSRQKRSCNPPKKYVEESPMLKRRRGRPRKHTTSSSRDKDLGFGSQENHHRKLSKRKASKETDSDDEYKPDISCSNARKRCMKKWTLDEVLKLVDGIAYFGSAWTSICRSFFSSSRRSPTDLRDKWRNLVKTNCKQLKAKKKDQHLYRSAFPLPTSVVERVRELAKAITKCRGDLSDSEDCHTQSFSPK